MKKSILDQSQDEILASIEAREQVRRTTTWKKPRRTTVSSLSKAWGIKKQTLINAILDRKD